jgi:FKBP-type peptidyl-prolyl cis-trans isomerase FkpA
MKRIPKNALLFGIIALSLCCAASLNAQDKKNTAKPAPKKSAAATTKGKSVKESDGFTRLASGLEYKIYTHGKGTRKPVNNDHIELNIRLHVGDSTIFDSRKMYGNSPVPLQITAAKFKGDPMEGFMLMVEGDSAVLRLPVDSMKKIGATQPWMKDGEKIEYNVVLVSVMSEEEFKKYTAEQEAKQKGIDDKLLQEYFAKNKIKPSKTASGLYYTVSSEGSGENGKAGQKYSVNYTGKLLNGNKFDSNVDSGFHHTTPFEVEVGKARVIKGWDEGLLLFKKGAKATLYIPSHLAYGSQDRSPQIPANSILIFDVEVLDIQTPVNQAETDDKLLKDYFAKNNIKAEKTPSGLYYSISQQGLGNNAKPGNKVTMNYTGKTLDGKVFDSNTDPSKGHVQPFTFTLGQGQVIKGWDEGVQFLKLGSRGTLYIPSALAYGERGAGGAIPPNAVLIFDVEVTGIDK